MVIGWRRGNRNVGWRAFPQRGVGRLNIGLWSIRRWVVGGRRGRRNGWGRRRGWGWI